MDNRYLLKSLNNALKHDTNIVEDSITNPYLNPTNLGTIDEDPGLLFNYNNDCQMHALNLLIGCQFF
jgi:hypothetical protein